MIEGGLQAQEMLLKKIESKDQQSGSMMILGGLGAVLLLAFAVGMSGDAIPNV